MSSDSTTPQAGPNATPRPQRRRQRGQRGRPRQRVQRPRQGTQRRRTAATVTDAGAAGRFAQRAQNGHTPGGELRAVPRSRRHTAPRHQPAGLPGPKPASRRVCSASLAGATARHDDHRCRLRVDLVRRRGDRAVEANFRSPSFETAFNIKREGGFADLILDDRWSRSRSPRRFRISRSQARRRRVRRRCSTRPATAGALEQLRAQFDFVIFDMPPVNVYSDASILCPGSTPLIVIGPMPRMWRSSGPASLERVGVRLVGSVSTAAQLHPGVHRERRDRLRTRSARSNPAMRPALSPATIVLAHRPPCDRLCWRSRSRRRSGRTSRR
jgi:hypothetical protein